MFVAAMALLFSAAISAKAEDCEPASTKQDPSSFSALPSLEKAIAARAFSRRGFISPAELRASDPKLLAEALVARLERECEATRPPEGKSELMRSDLVMVVPAGALPFIAQYGFANQHLTDGSGGALRQTNSRFRKEELMLGLQMPYSNKAREILPKYTLLNVHRDDVGKVGVPDFYGDVSVVFKNDVKKRATWTRADSMVVDFRDDNAEFPPRTASYAYDTARPFKCRGYCEAQVWGPLGIQDVDHLMVKKGATLSPELKALGLPIYEYEGTPTGQVSPEVRAAAAHSGQSTLFQLGERIWDGKGTVHAPPPSVIPTPVKNILSDRALANLSNAELKERFAKLPYAPAGERPGENFTPRAKLFAELSSRGIMDGNEAFLRAHLKDADPLVRREALIGLADLPAGKLKPLLLAALADKDRDVVLRAIAMAADFAEDPKVRAAVKKATSLPSEKDFHFTQELWKRLTQQKTYCEPAASPKR